MQTKCDHSSKVFALIGDVTDIGKQLLVQSTSVKDFGPTDILVNLASLSSFS